MLQQLAVRDLGAIAAADVEFAAGLTVITGETGAGKTMLMEALGLVLGDRADAGLVRTGADRAVVQARFGPVPGDVEADVIDAGGELDDDGTLLIVRTVGADGRSRAVLGGAAAPVGLLSRLSGRLVRVHGQHDRGLADAGGQRHALDRYAGTADLLDRYRAALSVLISARTALDAALAARTDVAAQSARLADDLAAIDAVDPQPAEDRRLRQQIDRLTHAESLRTSLADARAALAGDPDDPGIGDAITLLGRARDQVEQASRHDPSLADAVTRLADAAAAAGDVAADLSRSVDSLDADPARLAVLHDRLAAVTTLVRRFGGDADTVRQHAEAAREALGLIDGGDDRLESLRAAEAAAAADAGRFAGELSAARRAAADRFADSVAAELADLAMAAASIVVEVTDAESSDGLDVGGRRLRFGSDGVDEVAVLLSAHSGAPLRPLGKAASGGELSRIMLAAEVVFAGADPAGTFVFDEVDAGVGGRAAVEVGRRLASLGAGGQVLVVTHLPQVAAFADHHLVVTKDLTGSVGQADVVALPTASRAEELARMLAGLPDSELGRAHAAELLDLAARERAAAGR